MLYNFCDNINNPDIVSYNKFQYKSVFLIEKKFYLIPILKEGIYSQNLDLLYKGDYGLLKISLIN